MKRIAVLNEKGVIQRFVNVADDKVLATNEKLVVEEKTLVAKGQELVGPNYRIESDKVVAIYKAEPIDETRLDLILARIKALESKI